ncbi:MAG: CotH kinase family protein [Anaerolineae bacterium]
MNRKFFILISLTFFFSAGFSLFAEASNTSSVSFPLHVNVGSPTSYTADDGRLFLADQTWSASSWGFMNGVLEEFVGFELYATGGTDIKPVFATQRQSWNEFRASSIPNGEYLVTLHFREIRAHGADINRFDILAEGQVAIDDLDVYSHVGRDYALVRQFVVAVTDTELTLETRALEGIPHVSAISIQPIINDAQPPAVPTEIEGQGSYDSNQIDWAPVTAIDLKGYNVYRSFNGEPFTKITSEPVYITRYQDRSAEEGKSYQYQVSAVDVFGLESGLSSAVTASRLDLASATLPVFELTIDPVDWEFLYAFPFTENTILGQLVYEGESYDVTVRYRGKGSRLTNKKNWKIKFEGASPFSDRDTLNLNADNMDYTYLRGPLSYELLNSVGVDAPQHQYTLLMINGTYMGVYSDYEQIDENFMLRTGRDDDLTVFKAQNNLFKDLGSIAEYESAYEKNNNSSTGHTELIQFIEQLASTSDDQFPWMLQNSFDIQSYLDIYAYVVWVGQYDAFEGNHYLLHDRKTDKWELIPWDFDFAFGTIPSNFGFVTESDIDLGMDTERILPQRGVNVPQYRQYFCQKLQEYSTTILTPAALTSTTAAMQAPMLADARLDWLKVGWEDSSQLTNLPAEFGAFASARKARLDTQIPAYCHGFDRPYLKINEVIAQNSGAQCDPAEAGTAGCDDDWIEIYNEGLVAIDLNGMYLSDNASNLKQHRINGSLSVPPLGHVVIWADAQTNQGANHLSFTLADTDGEIYLSDSDGNQIDTLTWGALPEGNSAARLPDGTANIEALAAPTLGIANTKGAPQISKVSHTPAIPSATDQVTVQATVIDEGQFSATLYYQVDGGGFTPVPMTQGIDLTWSAAILAEPNSSRVQYYISAEDTGGALAVKPITAPDDVYEYVIGYQPPTVYINEIMASNDGIYFDPDEPDESPDYVEIYNPGPWAVNLAGMYVTDTLTKTQKFRLAQDTDQLIIEAGGYLIIIADDDGNQGPNHTGFKLSKGGEDFGLYDRADLGNSEIDSYTFDKQITNVAIGRCADGGFWQVLPIYSPGQTNGACGKVLPQFSDFAQTPKWPIAGANEPVNIEIKAVDDGSIKQVTLNYRLENGDWSSIEMSENRDIYSALLPNLSARGIIIEYYFVATDNDGLTAVYPAGAPERLQRYMYHTSNPEDFPAFAPPSTLHINELVANGVTFGIPDAAEPGEMAPWIELYNSGEESIDLEGYRLTHDLFFPHDYTIPAGVSIPADGYLVLILDDDPEQGATHVAFKPVRSGDTISLYTPHGVLIDEITYGPELENGAALSLITEESEPAAWSIKACPTPGQANRAKCGIFLPLIGN